MDYKTASEASNAIGESNDCTVKALAICADIPYQKAHRMLEQRGRKRGRGASMHLVYNALKDLGFKVSVRHGIRHYSGKHYTPKTIRPITRKGVYMAVTCNHVLAITNGQVEDWTKDGKRRILELATITR